IGYVAIGTIPEGTSNIPLLEGMTVPNAIIWSPVSYGSTSFQYTMLLNYGGNVKGGIPVGYSGGQGYANPYLLGSIQIEYENDAAQTLKDYFLTYQASTTTGRMT